MFNNPPTAFTRFKTPEDIPHALNCADSCVLPVSLLSQQWWSRTYTGVLTLPMQEHRKLIEHILRFGGREVCMSGWEPDLDVLLSDGEFMYGAGANFQPMKNGECHANSAALWQRSPEQLQIMTGYALTVDGFWRQHTWCLECATGRPLETTTTRLAYYGVVLSDDESKAFSLSNRYD